MTRKHALPALLAAAVLALYWPALGGGRVFFQRDVFNYWRPHIDWALSSLSSGRTIAWNPGLLFGTPFLADPNFQAFYPPTWLLAVISPSTWFALMVAGHAIFGGLGVAKLLKSLGFDRGASAGALAFALSGPVVSIASLWHHYCGAAWIPWVLEALHRLDVSEGRAWRRFALVSAMTALAGSAETVAMIVVLAGITQAGRFTTAARLRGLALAVAVCALVASVQWLPTWKALQSSSRAHFTPAQKLAWSLAPAAAQRLVVAGPYASGAPAADPSGAMVGDDDLPLVASPYLGAFLLPFAVWGAFPLPRVALAGAVFLAGSFGSHLGPAAGILAALMPFRFPTKLLAAAAVTFALLAGAGVHRALSSRPRSSAPVALVVSTLLVVVLAAQMAGAGRAGVVYSLLLGGAGLLALLFPPASALILAGAFVDLFTAGVWVNRYAAPELYRFRPPAADFVRRLDPSPRVFTVFPEGIAAQLELAKTSAIPALSFSVAVREGLVPPHGLAFGIRHGFGPDFTGLAVPEFKTWERFRGSAFGHDPGRYLSLGATTAVVSAEGLSPLNAAEPAARFQGVLRAPTRVDVWHRVGRAGLARTVRGTATLSDAMTAVAAADFVPGHDVAIAGEAGAPAVETLGGGEARIVRDENDVVEVESISSGPGLLVLRDTLREGWTATVDDHPVSLLRADVLFRGVRVPAGRSVVRFRYATPGLRVGIALCAVGLFVLARSRHREVA